MASVTPQWQSAYDAIAEALGAGMVPEQTSITAWYEDNGWLVVADVAAPGYRRFLLARKFPPDGGPGIPSSEGVDRMATFNPTDYVRGPLGAGIVADLRAYHGFDPVPGPDWELAELPERPVGFVQLPAPFQAGRDDTPVSWVGPPPIEMEVGKRYECQFSDCCTDGTFTGEYAGRGEDGYGDRFVNVELVVSGFQVVAPVAGPDPDAGDYHGHDLDYQDWPEDEA